MSDTKSKPEALKPQLQLADTNFKVPSDGWVKKTSPNGVEYLEAPKRDIWEIINCAAHPELNGEQLFTYDAAMRETEKAGKRMPIDEEWRQLLKTKEDMPNLVFAGLRSTDGSFFSGGSGGYFWSSLRAGSSAWARLLRSGFATVRRNTCDKALGFSVCCLKSSPKL